MTPVEEWERCKPWIEAALERTGGTHTIEDVERQIAEQKAVFLAGKSAALVCEILIYPQMRVFRIWLGGGDGEELKSWLPELSDLARAYGCSRLRIEGRHGWVRALRHMQLDRSWSVIEKEI